LEFIDCEKAFDSRQRQILFNMFNCRHIADTVIKNSTYLHTKQNIIKFNHKLSKPVQINKAVPQGFHISAALFNIYLDEIITKWQKQDITEIKLPKTQQLSTLLFADDQVITTDTEDNYRKLRIN